MITSTLTYMTFSFEIMQMHTTSVGGALELQKMMSAASICVCVCLYVCPRVNVQTVGPIVTKLGRKVEKHPGSDLH